VVLRKRQRLIEAPDVCHQLALNEHGGGRDPRFPAQQTFEDPALARAPTHVPGEWHALAVLPDLLEIRVAPAVAGLPRQVRHLELQLRRHPAVIRIEKGYVVPPRSLKPDIPRSRDVPLVRTPHDLYPSVGKCVEIGPRLI